MNDISIIGVLLILAVLLTLFRRRWLRSVPWQGVQELTLRLKDELLDRKPVYSAETTNAREAEFIRDRLPKRWSSLWLLTVVGLLGALIWLLAR